MTTFSLLAELRTLANPDNVAGMARFGISTAGTLGISIPTLRAIAKRLRKEHSPAERHALAEELWQSGVHEARLLAGFIDDPALVTEEQMERWVVDFDSWDVVDQVCGGLFDATPFAHDTAAKWSERDEEFVKRAAFALMAALSVHDKTADDTAFLRFLPIIRREACDDRNFVRKAVNWALRNIGKRNARLNAAAIETAQAIRSLDSRAARWIATDALRELRSEAVQRKVAR